MQNNLEITPIPLYNKKLLFIKPDFLKKYPNATDLGGLLWGNKLTHIDPNFLQYTPFVKYLEGFLKNNKLYFINPNFLQYTPRVTDLHSFLENNNLVRIDPDFLQYTPNVTNLDKFLTGNILTQQSVDGILVKLESYGTSEGVFGIDGGLNAPPSDGSESGFNGIAAVKALESRGWEVCTN